jgi:predicted secreted protein
MSDYVAQFGLGTELRIDIATVMTVVPWVQSITGPDETFDVIDVTTHSSVGGYREFITGLADGGELTCTINWHDDEAAHAALQDALTNRELTAFQLFWPGYDTLNLADFNGYVTGLTRASPTDAQITRDLTIKITGPVEVSTE